MKRTSRNHDKDCQVAEIQQALQNSREPIERMKDDFDDALFRRCQEAIRRAPAPPWQTKDRSASSGSPADRSRSVRRRFWLFSVSAASLAVAAVLAVAVAPPAPRSNDAASPLTEQMFTTLFSSPDDSSPDDSSPQTGVADQQNSWTIPKERARAQAAIIYPIAQWLERSPSTKICQAIEEQIRVTAPEGIQPNDLLFGAAELTQRASDLDSWQKKAGSYLVQLTGRDSGKAPQAQP